LIKPPHHAASPACLLWGAGRSWLRRPCTCAAAAAAQEQQAAPVSKRQQKKQQQQQGGSGGKGASAVTPRSTDFSRSGVSAG